MTTQNDVSIQGNKITEKTKIIPAKNARMFARLFNFGNLLALLPGLVVAPIILLGEHERISMIFMFMLVGHYTQQAAYRFYGMIGVVIPIGTFFGTDWKLWILMGGVVGLVIVPWTVWELIKTQKENWQDIEIMIEQTSGETS